MSNTSTVTPYDTRVSSSALEAGLGIAGSCLIGAAGAVAGLAIGTVALARWLAEETPEDRAAVDRLTARRRHERLRSQTARANRTLTHRAPQRLTTVSLHISDPEALVRAATQLGYRLEPLPQPAAHVAEQPLLLLRKPSGERLAIARNAQGRLVVQTAGDRERVQTLVRQHTMDRAIEHLAHQGMHVQTATLPNGEVQILAQEGSGGFAAWGWKPR